mmetsp:Transcript_14001/g.23192  ORF Transcript_14001/g.23192 Transcript_14001/m.23192 type:complete len:381 (-) Transcript_14001:177-1319(-)
MLRTARVRCIYCKGKHHLAPRAWRRIFATAPTSKRDDTDLMSRRSFYQRALPAELVGFSTTEGKTRLIHAAADGLAESYFPLAEQFITQSEPAFCGPSCLAMVLNTLRIDPNTTWKGGWRWFDERTLALGCCKPLAEIEVEGITLDEFAALGRCHGATVDVFRPGEPLASATVTREHRRGLGFRTVSEGIGGNVLIGARGNSSSTTHTAGSANVGSGESDVVSVGMWASASRGAGRPDLGEDMFRQAIISACTSSASPYLVVSFLRTTLGQTGTGHFSPVAAYHAPTDSALVLDIARFKLPPYWAPVSSLYAAMKPHDLVTAKPRGYALLYGAPQTAGTERSMAQLGGGGGRCPVGAIKREYCPISVSQSRQRLQRAGSQ